MQSIRRSLLLCAVYVLPCATALANPFEFQTDGDPVPDGGNFKYTYKVVLGDDSEKFTSGNSITVFDFAGFVPGSLTMPANWTASTQAFGPGSPQEIDPPGNIDTAVLNLVFSYTGGADWVGPGELSFSANSVFGPDSDFGQFLANYLIRPVPAGSFLSATNSGYVAVPVPEPSVVGYFVSAAVSLAVGLRCFAHRRVGRCS
jgi:hypothetical protein